jgi:integrase
MAIAVMRNIMRNLSWLINKKKGMPMLKTDGISPVTESRFGIEHFTPHDLRKIVATFMPQPNKMDEVINAVFNHAKQGVIKVYNQYRFDLEKQKALETWERKFNSIMSGKESNVVLISAGKKVV